MGRQGKLEKGRLLSYCHTLQTKTGQMVRQQALGRAGYSIQLCKVWPCLTAEYNSRSTPSGCLGPSTSIVNVYERACKRVTGHHRGLQYQH